MREPERPADVQRPMRRLNPTLLALLAGLVVLLLLIAYFASSRDPDQDKLKDSEITSTSSRADQSPEKRCSSKATYELIKRDLFRRAAQLRGSDQAAFDRLAAYAALRMSSARAVRPACSARARQKPRQSACRAMPPGHWRSGWQQSATPSASTSRHIRWMRRGICWRLTRFGPLPSWPTSGSPKGSASARACSCRWCGR